MTSTRLQSTPKSPLRTLICALMVALVLLLSSAVVEAQTDTSQFQQMGSGYTPQGITTSVEYDEQSGTYVRITKVGETVLSRDYLSFQEYQDWQMDQLMNKYWNEKIAADNGSDEEQGFLDKIPGFSEISRKIEGIMGGNIEPKISPSGSVELTFQLIHNYRDNPSLDLNRRSYVNFDFDANVQLNLNVKLGDLLDFDVNYNNLATFDFENQIKLRHEGKEDDILQLIEVGNISFPLNTTLIQGSQQLMGFHTKLKFGKFSVDALWSQKQTSTENMQVKGGASSHEFEIRADEYEENRHYFIAQYFYDNYNTAMATLPIVNSNIKIIRLEVWRTNVGAAVTQNRNLLALTDLGEANPSNRRVSGTGRTLPSNQSNNLLQLINTQAVRSINSTTEYMQGLGFENATDYEKIESARLLNPSEYTFNRQLGFITLNQPLSNDQVLAVAFQYQIVGDTNVYQVGELTTDGINDPNTLIVKLLKSTTVDTHGPLWRLMMKNVYFLKSSQLSQDGFRLNVLYESSEGGVGIGYFTEGPKEGTPLIEVFGLDRMDASQSYYYADGVFDWFDSAAYKGGLIQSTTGRVFFPYVEPFGKDLRAILNNDEFANIYCFDSLYTMTQTLAQQYADKNKFYLEGYYTTTVSGEISLGYSVAQGSVTVTAGGVPLIENVDYTVDYTMGTVRIINESILSSGTPISVSSENNSFSMMTKTMLGLHLNYEVEPDFNVGGTFMSLSEQPLTQKNNFGDEPTSNSIWGLDLTYRHEVPWITKAVDLLPGIQTKAPSTLSLTAEFAHFIPGMSRTGMAEGNVSYIDDFEGAESSIDLRGTNFWHLASTPQDYATTLPMFPETAPGTGLAYGYNRAHMAWYRVDNRFYERNNRFTGIDDDEISRPYARRVYEQEVFPNKEIAANTPTIIYDLNLAYYPSERGPYNYDVAPGPYSAGVDADGNLNNPQSRWAGIMRKLDYTDFETQNIETIEFWLMDPFIENPNHTGGKFYINLGDVSEDILRDGRKSFENGLPPTDDVLGVDTTIWGRVPNTQPMVNAFDNDETARKYQDIGYDGLSSTHGMDDEQSFFADYVQAIADRFGVGSGSYQQASSDPSSDDFRHYASNYYDEIGAGIVERYKYYNNPEGNSPVNSDSDNSSGVNTSATSYPDVEDINNDNTLSEAENYYQYVINLSPDKMQIGENHIVDIQESSVQLRNGQTTTCKWYQFRIPIREPDQTVGKVNGYQSIRFIRMFLSQFSEPIILRFATLDLVYSTWRKYSEDLLQPGDYQTGGDANTSFSISTVSIEENGSRQPVPYVLPPGVYRESWYTSSSAFTKLNEQAVSLDIDNLNTGDARAIYRNSSYDLRHYGSLRMYAHAEKKYATDNLDDDDLALFVRLGSDYTNNYYEYELPLKLTPWYTSADSREAIWPTENNVDIDLQKFVEIKTNRNRQARSGGNVSSVMLYTENIEGCKYSVLGSPNLGKVKVIMIGVRNPKKKSLNDGNNMLPKSAIVWVNELRLADYINRGGWAAMALARTNLADLGNLSLYTAYSSSGFGNLEDHLSKVDLVNSFNFQTTLDMELGKFLPESWGVHLPMYLDYNKEIGSPEYNPYDPDVLLADDLKTYTSVDDRDSVRSMTQKQKSATNLTFTNIRKDRISTKSLTPHFYDVENFTMSYAYSRERSSDDETAYYHKDQHRGSLQYNFSPTSPKNIRPFDKVKLFNNNNLKLIKDINFYYLPKNVSFSTEVYRDYEETMLRNKSAALVILKPTYFKQFTWQRNYGVQYDLARSIHITYSANANARIDEPIGPINSGSASDSIWHSLSRGGTMQDFQQAVNLTWNLPINKLPYLDFVQMPFTYRTTYKYEGTTPALATMGGSMQNSTTMQTSLSANFQTLYNKIPLLKKAYATQTPTNGRNPRLPQPKQQPKKAVDSTANADSLRHAKMLETLKNVAYFGLRLVSSVKDVNLNYNSTSGSHLPGYLGEPMLVGLDPRTSWSPGLGYVLGFDTDVAESLLYHDLLSSDTLFNSPHELTANRVFSATATVEPIRDFSIKLNATQNYTSRESYYYKYMNDLGRVDGPLSRIMTGSYNTTIWSFATAFANSEELFQRFLDNRTVVANRLASLNPDPYTSQQVLDTMNGQLYPAGYSGNSQSVLLTSFLATYLGHDPAAQAFSPFLKLPLPNWTINYNGLNKVQFLKKWFTNITMSHKYTSTYTVGNFYTDAAIASATDYDYGLETVLNSTGDYIPPMTMDAVQISEQFNPLIRLSLNMVNSFNLNFSVKKTRNLALSFSNNQLTETSSDGVTFGTGYRFRDVAVDVQIGGTTHKLKSDLVLQLNLTYTSNKTNIRKINSYNPALGGQITSGNQVWMAELSAEYAVSTAITLRAFITTNINHPYISSSYDNSTTKGGITARISF
ncbi:MAG: cell surface protein SprA [Bacteroidales bacterium]|nr:cell surface protein SprA [Bacteroidales bacterium]